ncbi:MAG: adenylate/guanylate cyclase domain-containing protein [Kovacikia sp.]
MRKRLWKWRSIWLTAPGIAGLVILLRLAGLLQYWEWLALDQFFILRPPEPPDSRIVVVGISDQDIKNLGRWPVEDTRLAELLERIKQQQPRAIGLDLYRDFPIEPGYQKLVKVFETTPNLIGIERKGGANADIPIAPPPALAKQGQVSSNDILTDGDGKIRRGFLYWTSQEDNTAIEGLGLKLALIYLQAKGINPKPAATNPDYLQVGRGVFPIFESGDGGYIRADAAGYQILLNFRGPSNSFQTVSMTDILEGRVSPNLLRDRLVFIGPIAESLKDLFLTPYSSASLTSPDKTAGVEIQATIASQVLSAALEGRPGIQVWSDPLEYAWIVLWAFVGALLGWWLRTLRWAIAGMIAVEGSLLVGCYLAFLGGWWIPTVPPALALATAAIVLTGYIANQEREDRQIIMHLFGRHVNPKIAEEIWRDRHRLLNAGRLTGRKMTATVLFTDLKDFSGITERTDPEILMSWLNEYMEAMSQIVLAEGGIVDKFIGDSIMAVFGVPLARTAPEEIAEDAQTAVRCAVKMAATLEALNFKWQSQGRPTTSMRVGISTGMVVTGSLGGEQRLDYTTIGDSVNVASRLESYDKSLEGGICRILISEDTYTRIQNHFPTKFIGMVQLRGLENPTKIYQVLTKLPIKGD